MTSMPDRHPQRDLFILDIADVVPKDDTASMEHPLFSLATRPDTRHLSYKNGDIKLEVIPSILGLPTIKDKDILIFCVSQLMHRKNQGEKLTNRVRFSARELMIATNRNTDGREYMRLEKAFQRLQGTQFKSNIKTGNTREVRIFSLIDEGGFVVKADGKGRLDYCEVVLSDWMMRALEHNEIVTISFDYFRLRRPLERRIYEIIRKHCGEQAKWQISLKNLQNKTGSNAPLRSFRLNIRQIIKDNHIPDYLIELTDKDLVIVRPRSSKEQATPRIKPLKLTENGEPHLKPDTFQKAFNAAYKATGVRIDKYQMHADWLEFWRDSGKPELGNNDASFIGFCKKRAADLR